MRGLYLDVPRAQERVRALGARLGVRPTIAEIRDGARSILINHHPLVWPEGPIYQGQGILAAASGWLVYDREVGALGKMAEAFAAAMRSGGVFTSLDRLTGGAFLVYLRIDDREFLVTDPFGLHPHYGFEGDRLSRIAPVPSFLDEGPSPRPELASMLERQGHLFGNLTAYEGIVRLDPGSIITREDVTPYFDYWKEEGDLTDLLPTLRTVIDLFAGRPKILPLSGGLDSRLLLAAGRFDKGYTFGPAATGDRPVARRFSGHFSEYREFSLLDIPHSEEMCEASGSMFAGVWATAKTPLLGVYRHLHDLWGGDYLFCSGYAGDVLQRGTWLTSGGIQGSLAKLLPALTLRGFDPYRLLRRRYAKLSDREFDWVAAAFDQFLGSTGSNAMKRVVLFEILYGRGSRFIHNGTILASQYFPAFEPFFFPQVFWNLFPKPEDDKLNYRVLKEIWESVPKEFSDVITYSGYKPIWNSHRSRAAMLATKALAKAGVYRRAKAYDSEIPNIRWEPRPKANAREPIGDERN